MKFLFEVIMHDRRRNELMEACGVFERGKVLGDTFDIEVETTGTPSPRDVLDVMIKRLTKDPNIVCSFIYLDDEHVWWDRDVRAISNGSGWGMLHEIIRQLYPKLLVKTDENMYITSITRNQAIY